MNLVQWSAQWSLSSEIQLTVVTGSAENFPSPLRCELKWEVNRDMTVLNCRRRQRFPGGWGTCLWRHWPALRGADRTRVYTCQPDAVGSDDEGKRTEGTPQVSLLSLSPQDVCLLFIYTCIFLFLQVGEALLPFGSSRFHRAFHGFCWRWDAQIQFRCGRILWKLSFF